LDVSSSPSLTGLSEKERKQALDRFQLLRPSIEEGVPLSTTAKEHGLTLRTMQRWLTRYRNEGLAGLARKCRIDKDQGRRASDNLRQLIEGLALQRPQLSAASIHRRVIDASRQLGERCPSYSMVYSLIRRIEPALLTMAHEGTKAYSDTYDLVHRTEAERPNAIWQADHTQLNIVLRDDNGTPAKPWLTIVLDDYSRAIAGYRLFFSAPSALQTALALRQAIWRKAQANWHICGIPQILYTDHGSDFTSHHMEQVSADLKIQLIFSAVGKPRGRGKIERFFESLSQVFLSRLPGYGCSIRNTKAAVLTLPELSRELENYLINEYLVTPHRTTHQPPQKRWDAGGFLPQMPASLEQLDLLLLTVPKTRRVQSDGIRFMGMRYIDPTLSAYVGEEVLLRYDPRDVAEIRVFYKDMYLCRAVCQELAGETVPLREIVNARNRRRRQLRQTIQDRKKMVDSLIEVRKWTATPPEAPDSSKPRPDPAIPKLKLYHNE
jgi:putative transposase